MPPVGLSLILMGLLMSISSSAMHADSGIGSLATKTKALKLLAKYRTLWPRDSNPCSLIAFIKGASRRLQDESYEAFWFLKMHLSSVPSYSSVSVKNSGPRGLKRVSFLGLALALLASGIDGWL